MILIKEFILRLTSEEACALKKFLGNVPAKFLHDKGLSEIETSTCSDIWRLLPQEEGDE